MKNVDTSSYYFIDRCRKDSDFIKNASKGLKTLRYFVQPSIMNFNSFTSVYSVIIYSCICIYGRKLNYYELNSIAFSDMVYKLTMAVDDFYNMNEIRVLDKKFFKMIRDIKLDKTARKIDELIYYGFFVNLDLKYLDEPNPEIVEFSYCASYLSRCYAINRGRKIVTAPDITDGWILTLKIFFNDIRPCIPGLDCSTPPAILPSIESYNNIIEVNNSQISLKKIFAIFISIIFFLSLFVLLGFTLQFLTGDSTYGYSPYRRYIIIGVFLSITTIFYNKLKNLLKF